MTRRRWRRLRRLIWIELHPYGPRLWVLGARVHHGFVGVCAMVAGTAMVTHDWGDRFWSLQG